MHVSASCYSKGSSAAVSAGLRTVYLHPDKIDDHFLYREDGRDGRRYDQRYDPIDGNVWGSARRTRFADVLPSCEAIPHARLGVGPLPDDRDEFDEFGAVDRGNTAERIKYLEYFKSKADELGIKYLWWDNGYRRSFALFDRKNGKPYFKDIVETLVK